MKLWKLLGAILEERSPIKRMDRAGARGLTCLWNGFVSINGKNELMLTGRRKKWTLEGWEGSDRWRKGKCAK